MCSHDRAFGLIVCHVCRLHPSARQTQLNFSAPLASRSATAFFRAAGDELYQGPSDDVRGRPLVSAETSVLQAYDIVLGPGDVLYLPPYWFHHVTALDTRYDVAAS